MTFAPGDRIYPVTIRLVSSEPPMTLGAFIAFLECFNSQDPDQTVHKMLWEKVTG